MEVKYANLQNYPKHVRLENGTHIVIRPLTKDDKITLLQFFQRVPEEDRFYLKENVTAPEVIHQWTEHIDLERVIPLVAEVDGKIVADGTLHRSRSPARRHVGELRIVVDPEYRGMGIGTRLVQELIDVGRGLGLHKLFFELVERRERRAVQAALDTGFQEVAVLRDRIKDIYGSLQDLVIMELPLREEAAGGRF